MNRFNIGYGIGGWRPEESDSGRYLYFKDADKYIQSFIKREIELKEKIRELEETICKFRNF